VRDPLLRTGGCRPSSQPSIEQNGTLSFKFRSDRSVFGSRADPKAKLRGGALTGGQAVSTPFQETCARPGGAMVIAKIHTSAHSYRAKTQFKVAPQIS